ncbi:MAG: hypothetical protein RL219_2557 [Actinomycetota bacterium]
MRGDLPRASRVRQVMAAVGLAAVISSGVVASATVGAAPAQAQSSSELRAKASKIADQIDRLGAEFARLAESFNEAQVEADALEVELETSTARVKALESELGGMRSSIRDFAVKMFASGGQLGGIGELLGGSAQLTETVVRDQYASLALTTGQQASDELESKLNQLSAAKRALQKQQRAKAELAKTLASRRKAAEKKQQQLEKLQSQVKSDLREALAEEEARRDAAARARARAEAEEARRNNNNGGGNSGGGNSNSGGGRGGGRGGNSGGGNSGGGNNGGGGGGNSGGGGNNGGGNNGGGNNGGGGAGRDVPPPSPGASGAVAAAKSQLGVMYRAFMARPGYGFDCSGLTAWAWARAGVRLPHQSRLQYRSTERVPISEAQPGDLLFFYSPISHVGMYLGDGLMIDASRPGKPISIHGFKWSSVVGVGRPR